jgi:trk system potassium uptake protein TrkH
VASGALFASAPVPLALLARFHDPALWGGGVVAMIGASTLSIALLVGAITFPRHDRTGRVSLTVALVAAGMVLLRAALGSPFLALTILLVASTALTGLWHLADSSRGRTRLEALVSGRARGASALAALVWALSSATRHGEQPLEQLAVHLSLTVAAGLVLAWAITSRGVHRGRAAVLAGTAVGAGVVAGLGGGSVGFAVFAVVAAVTIPRVRPVSVQWEVWWEPLLGHPERLVVGTFAALIAAGTLVLSFPGVTPDGSGLHFLDAAFTSVSAVCVTGLIVVDTATAFNAVGQAMILLLIQLGGLGIMTYSTVLLQALGRRISLRHEGAVARLVSSRDRGRLFDATRRVLVLTLVCEAVGAILLFFGFLAHGDGAGTAVWRAVFTAVSAFCNAGFALDSASLVPYSDSPLILHAVAALIVVGGLSPAAVVAMPRLLRRTVAPVAVQTRIALAAAAVLLGVAFVFLLAVEWSGALGHLAPLDRIHHAWFQSVTLRTAGFNSIDLSIVNASTLSLMMAWMFVGGSPGGTAGGIKTTTVTLLALSVYQAVRGRGQVTLFGRTVRESSVRQAAVVTTLALVFVGAAIIALQLTQDMPARFAVFEAVSAFGTVGLSIGGTALLDGPGKLIVMACMFVGRVGTVTLLMFLAQRETPPAISRPEEEVDVG